MPNSKKTLKILPIRPTPTSQVPALMYLMMSIWSYETLRSTLSLSSHGSNYWKNILPELNNILLSQLNYLKDGLDLYNSAKVSNSVLNGKAVYTDGNSTLYEYPCEDSDKIVLFIPSLINKSSILDLSESQSLLLRFQNSNVKPYLYNWGEPTDEEENFSIADYLNNRLLKVIDFITKQEKKKIIFL